MNIFAILIAAFVVLLLVGWGALAWGIRHAPEAHEDETGFHVDRPASSERRKKATPAETAQTAQHEEFGVEPVWY